MSNMKERTARVGLFRYLMIYHVRYRTENKNGLFGDLLQNHVFLWNPFYPIYAMYVKHISSFLHLPSRRKRDMTTP